MSSTPNQPENNSNKENLSDSKNQPEADKLVTISTYARLCDASISTIYARLDKNDPTILQLSKVPGVEGVFINVKVYPPKKYKRGWKKGNKRKKTEEPEVKEEPITDVKHYVKLTIELAHDKIKDITDKNEERQVFKKFIHERHEKIKHLVTINEFYELIKNHQ